MKADLSDTGRISITPLLDKPFKKIANGDLRNLKSEMGKVFYRSSTAVFDTSDGKQCTKKSRFLAIYKKRVSLNESFNPSHNMHNNIERCETAHTHMFRKCNLEEV